MKLAAGTSFAFALVALAGGIVDFYLYSSRGGLTLAIAIAAVMLYLGKKIAADNLSAMYAACGIAVATSVIYAVRLIALENLVAAVMMGLSFCALFLILLGFFVRLKSLE